MQAELSLAGRHCDRSSGKREVEFKNVLSETPSQSLTQAWRTGRIGNPAGKKDLQIAFALEF